MLYKKRRKYKYNLHSEEYFETGLSVGNPKDLGFVTITQDGILTVKKSYAWDGPSGPTIDTKTFMRGSLIHDALYQLIRERVLPMSDRERADQILKEVCLQEGMPNWRAWYVYKVVRLAGASSANPDLLTAP